VFEVVIFTASEKSYANMVLNRIDPGRQFIHHRLFRDSCIPLKGNYVKDLGMLGRDLDKTIIIDNNLLAF
jgi:CTD small phosphatase-like protein 2